MWLPVLSLTIIYVLLEIIKVNSTTDLDDNSEILFRQRTNSEWENVWHHESHSRCREKLIRHLYWACEKDIYRLTRRSHFLEGNIKKRTNNIKKQPPWLKNNEAKRLLHTRRYRRSSNSGTSITAECCTKIGCTWEEYAEYCPSNKRKNHGIKFYN